MLWRDVRAVAIVGSRHSAESRTLWRRPDAGLGTPPGSAPLSIVAAVAPGTSVSETMEPHRRSPMVGLVVVARSGGAAGGARSLGSHAGRCVPTAHLTRNSVSSERSTPGKLISVLLLIVSRGVMHSFGEWGSSRLLQDFHLVLPPSQRMSRLCSILGFPLTSG